MKVAVFAGALADTKMGVHLLETHGYEPLPYPMSKTPDEQRNMQYFSKEKLENTVKDKAIEAKELGAEVIFIYCNSLSAAIDYSKIEDELSLPILTPMETYKNLPNTKNALIMTANGISAYLIDKIIQENNPGIGTIPIGNMAIVNAIEAEAEPKVIIDELNIKSLIQYAENIQGNNKVDSLVVGCTHFPYIIGEIRQFSSLNIIDPTDEMLNTLKKIKNTSKYI